MTANKKQSTKEEAAGNRIHHGKNIRVFMLMRNWTIEQLAEKVGLSSRTVSNYLATEKLSEDILKKFADALEGIDIFWLKSSVNEKLERFAGVNCEKFIEGNYTEGNTVDGYNTEVEHIDGNIYNTPVEPVQQILTQQIQEKNEEIRQLKEENSSLRKEVTEIYKTAYLELKEQK